MDYRFGAQQNPRATPPHQSGEGVVSATVHATARATVRGRMGARGLWHALVLAVLAFCIALTPAAPVLAAPVLPAPGLPAPVIQGETQPDLQTANEFGDESGNAARAEELAYCDALEPDALRDELNSISQDIFAQGESGLDMDAIVQREWAALRMDAAIDNAVDDAVEDARARRDWLETFLSGWSPNQAEALTAEIATSAFTSEAFSTAMDSLAEAVATAVATEFAALAAESAAQTTYCLQAYIGGNYSQAFVAAFAEEVRAGADQADLSLDDELNAGLMTILGQHRAALGGVGVIIVSQIAGRIVRRIGQDLARRVAGRVAGRVLGRVGAAAIPALGWIVGIGLLVYDVAEGRDGALPQIQTSLQSVAVKETIQGEIVAAIGPELRLAAPQVARELASELYAEWLDFQRKYGQVLLLAEENPQFDALLSDVGDLGHLATLVDVLLTTLGRPAFDSAVADGDFPRLLNLPPAAVEILRSTGEIDAPLAWANLAGGQLEQVVNLEIYKHQNPQTLDRATLTGLIALEDATTVGKLILLEPATIETLLRISSANLGDVAARLSSAELEWLARYVERMEPEQANQLVSRLVQEPGLMARLQDEALVTLLAETEQLPRALAFLSATPSPEALPGDLWVTLSGQVPRVLFIHKYGWPVSLGLASLTLLIVLAVAYSFLLWLLAPLRALGRLFGRGRKRDALRS